MVNVNNSSKGILVIAVLAINLILNSCDYQSVHKYQMEDLNKLYLDVWKDSRMDTLIKLVNTKGIEFYIINNGIKEKIISISPLIDKGYISTTPKIETVSIQGNAIQTDDKGIRISVRNTDLTPDFYFIDLKYSKEKRI